MTASGSRTLASRPDRHHRPGRVSTAGLVQVSLAGVLWGTGGLAVQLVRDHAPLSVLTVSAWRMGVAALVLAGAVAVARHHGELLRLLRARPWQTVLVGSGTAAYQALYFASVVTVGVTVATVVSLGLAPVLVTVGEAVVARRRPTPTALAVLVVALAGLLLVSGTAGWGSTGPHPVLGVLLAVLSGATYAVTTVLGRPLAALASPLALTTATTTAGALVLLPLGLLGARGDAVLLSADPTVLALLLYLGVATMALAYGLLYAGLRTVPGSAAVVASLLEPVTAALLAAALLGERLGAAGVVGTLLILAAVGGLARSEAPPA